VPPPPTSRPGVPLPPAVAVTGDQIVIEGLTMPPDVADELASAGDEEEARAAAENALAEKPDELATRLRQYLEHLVHAPAPAEQELRLLRDKLQEITVDQRRQLAEEAAQLRETIVEQVRIATTQSASAGPGGRTITVSIDPARVRELALALSDEVPSRLSQISPWEKIVGTILLLIVAALVLKAATRRHSGVRYF
jgi:hypothetical protein